MGKFTRDLGINCDESNRCSSAKRRGCSQRPLGYDYVPGAEILQPDPPVTPEKNWRELLG